MRNIPFRGVLLLKSDRGCNPGMGAGANPAQREACAVLFRAVESSGECSAA